MAKALEMIHVNDPKQELWDSLGEFVKGTEMIADRLLLGVYKRPEKTAGGIILTQTAQAEDDFQGKVGLVLKMGPLAFTEDEGHQWGGVAPKVGDWVLFRTGDTFSFTLGEKTCRIIREGNVQAILDRPDMAL